MPDLPGLLLNQRAARSALHHGQLLPEPNARRVPSRQGLAAAASEQVRHSYRNMYISVEEHKMCIRGQFIIFNAKMNRQLLAERQPV